jgi:MFS family permease
MVFMLYGCAYALLNPFWGWLADRVAPRLVILTGSLLLSTGLSLVSRNSKHLIFFSNGIFLRQTMNLEFYVGILHRTNFS